MDVTQRTNDFAVRVHMDAEMTVELSGELDLASAPVLQATLDQIPYESVRHIRLDLENLSFIDARGLRAVLAFHETCRAHAVQLSIRRGPRNVQRLFDLTHTELILPFEPS